MKKVAVTEAVGMVLCHDITRIIPGEYEGPAFKKGHIIKEEDVPELLKLGKEHIYVWETREGVLHEDDAARRMAVAAAGDGLRLTEPSQGKVNLVATRRGLLKINVDVLKKINSIELIMMATLHNNRVVDEGRVVAGTRIIPLVIEEEKIKKVEELCREAGWIIEVKPLRRIKVGMVTTGNEVFYGRIKDGFGPVVRRKLEAYGCEVYKQVFAPDDVARIAAAVQELKVEGAELILTTGGMSVDPDDVTPTAVAQAGGRLVTYGAPILPGSMFMVAYLDGTPVLGLPGCVMYSKRTIFDLILPRVLAGETIKREEIASLGHGGLCLECDTCHFPVCPFGTGA